MAEQTVIVTGGNSGLGFHCAKTIASSDQDWHVLIASRNYERSLEAIEKIKSSTGNKNVSTLKLDLASLVSVRRFASEYRDSNLPPLKGLVCNAGIQARANQVTEDGYERTFGVNHLGHFLLVDLLIKELVQPARIVVVSSDTHDPEERGGKMWPATYLGGKELADPEKSKQLSRMQLYTTSKLCNLLFAYELDRRCKQKNMDITVNAFNPAFTPGTNLGNEGGRIRKVMIPIAKILSKIMGIVSSTPEKSGGAMARLILDPLLENVSGKYFQIFEERNSSKDSYDEEKARDLWESSLELIKTA